MVSQLCELGIPERCAATTNTQCFLRWERRLLEDDVCALIRFRKEKYPVIDKYFRGLDFLSARTIVNGLVAYGWTYEELSKCRSNLMTQLFQYVDREQLAHGQIRVLDLEPCRKCRRLGQDNISMELSNRSDAQPLHQSSTGLKTTNLAVPVNNDTDGIQSLLGAIYHVQPSMPMETLSHSTQHAESSAAAAASGRSEGANTDEWNEILDSEANITSSVTSRTANADSVPCATARLSTPETQDGFGESFLV